MEKLFGSTLSLDNKAMNRSRGGRFLFLKMEIPLPRLGYRGRSVHHVSNSMPITKSVFTRNRGEPVCGSNRIHDACAVLCCSRPAFPLFDIMKRADGKPGTEAGVAMSIMAVPMFFIALLGQV